MGITLESIAEKRRPSIFSYGFVLFYEPIEADATYKWARDLFLVRQLQLMDTVVVPVRAVKPPDRLLISERTQGDESPAWLGFAFPACKNRAQVL